MENKLTQPPDVSNPESYEDLVELLVPVLQKRGIMWEDYDAPGGTYRENMLRTAGQKYTTEGHRSRAFTFENLKDKMDGNGVITIDREDKAEEAVAATNGLKLTEQLETVKATA